MAPHIQSALLAGPAVSTAVMCAIPLQVEAGARWTPRWEEALELCCYSKGSAAVSAFSYRITFFLSSFLGAKEMSADGNVRIFVEGLKKSGEDRTQSMKQM